MSTLNPLGSVGMPVRRTSEQSHNSEESLPLSEVVSDKDRFNRNGLDLDTVPSETLPPTKDEWKWRNFPPHVYLIIGNEFCERFSYYGMRAILTIYFIEEHGYTGAQASLVFHAFASLSYFCPLPGSILADNYLGRYKVILYVSAVYVVGHVILTIGGLPGVSTTGGFQLFLEFAGLLTIAVATGGIKPCVSAFGADQFAPELKREREIFFSFFYFAVNAGGLFATILTPVLRGRVRCFGKEYCFPLAFGVPAVLMLIAFLVFLAGAPLYRRQPATGNIVVQVIGCIGRALKQRSKGKQTDKSDWLDYAYPEYDQQLISGVRSFINILVVFIPIPLFWALFDQQGSTWVVQSRRMNTRLGYFNALPEQFIAVNAIFMMFLIPFVETVVTPMCKKIGFPLTSLRKIGIGGFLAAFAFFVSGFLQIAVNATMVPVSPPGHVQVRLMNSLHSCSFILSHNDHKPVKSQPLSFPEQSETVPAGEWILTNAPNTSQHCQINASISLGELHNSHGHKQAFVVGIFGNATHIRHKLLVYHLEKTVTGKTRIYTLFDPFLTQDLTLWLLQNSQLNAKLDVTSDKDNPSLVTNPPIFGSDRYTLSVGENSHDCILDLAGCQVIKSDWRSGVGAAMIVVLWDREPGDRGIQFNLSQLIQENSVSILWQLPQFFLVTLAEVFLSIAGLEFSYSQAAPNMRSVCQAFWLLTTFLGNCIAMAISGGHLIEEPHFEFFFYAGTMTVVMIVFIWIAIKYKYVDPEQPIQDNNHTDCDG